MNPIKRPSAAILVAVLCLCVSGAQACGEVMFRAGAALRYHAFVTRHPAAILLYDSQASVQPLAARTSKLHDELERAGHHVTVVRGPDELAHALAANAYDVLVADVGAMDKLQRQFAEAPHAPTLIPVVDEASQDEGALRDRFPRLVRGNADVNDYLKVIEQSMKARGT